MQLNPAHAGAAGNLGAILNDEENTSEAKEILMRGIKGDPKHVECHINLGMVLKKDGMLEGAIASFQKAIQVKPNSLEALSGLAQCLMDVGRVSESLGVYESCSRLNPWDPSNCELPALACDSSEDLRLSKLAVDLYEIGRAHV